MEVILEIQQLKKTFYKEKRAYTAVDIDRLAMKQGSCLGIAGESGCGKSTMAKLITHLIDADEGNIFLDGENITNIKGRECKKIYQKVQMVFQMPQDSFDPRQTLGRSITESMRNAKISRRQADERLKELLNMVELPMELAERYPHQVSGGQCQRAAIARALAVNPKLIICDEATSALDVTVQGQIIQLLKRLQSEQKLSLLMICHDLALVQEMCDEVAVMQNGKIAEWGRTEQVLYHPEREYTKRLIEAAL